MTRSRTSRSPKNQPPRSLNKWLGWAWKLGIVALVLLGGLAIYL
ncbi:hypothetical protein RA277_31800, partial [Pseudomonas syringae pv. tagetis]